MTEASSLLDSCTSTGPDRVYLRAFRTHADVVSRVDQLAAALEELPAACREAFLLNRLDGLTHVEIARRFGVCAKSVQRYIERALRHCLDGVE